MSFPAQRSFAGGELAPSLWARTDQQKYSIGLRTCRNHIVQRHGGITNRSGTQFISEVRSSAGAVRLIPFERSRTEAYVLEFGNLYVRMIRNGAYVSLPTAASGWVFPFAYAIGDTASWLGINYVNISGTNPNTNPLAAPTVWYPLIGLIYELPTPYAAADLPAIRFAQRSGASLTGVFGLSIKATILVLTHPSYAPRELSSPNEQSWALSLSAFVPAIGTPVGPIVFGGGAAGVIQYWAVTAISDIGEESLVLTGNALNRIPSVGTPTTLTWNPPAAGFPATASYRVYRSTDGIQYGFIGVSTGTAFSDTGTTANLLAPAPSPRTVFNVADQYPTAVSHYQQRLLFGNTNIAQETIWGSKTGKFTNFSISFPLQADDSVTFTMVGRQLNAIQHLLDLGRLVAFTHNEEKLIEGDVAGILKPDAINPRKLSANGSGILRPIEIDDTAIYVQARNTIVRDLKPVDADSYQGTDLTVWASHLFNGYTLVDWAYSQSPNSVVWCVRSDGVMLGLTYLREHNIFGWHRHDTDGIVENVCVIPEGNEDKVYLVVRRTISGITKRYIERMAPRYYSALRPEDAYFVDCGVTYDGWNTSVKTLTISGGPAWDDTKQLTLTASSSQFTAADVGNIYIVTLLDAAGNETGRIRLTVEAYSSVTVVLVRASGTVPAGLQGVARATWAKAVKSLTGLSYLEGKTLSVMGDGYVVASPYNTDAAYPTVTVSGGTITLPQPYAIIRAGLPYISDMQPLDLDLAGGSTIKDKKMLVNEVGMYMERSRGVWIGDPDGPTTANPVNGLREWKAKADEAYASPVAERTDFFKVKIRNEWGSGRFLVRQVDPLPLTILSVTPIGYVPQ